MKLDELAFLNRQLAAMLKDGLPLEGALLQLSRDISRGRLRDEFDALHTSLVAGEPLESALAVRRFPQAYRTLLLAGARSGNLPGVLVLAADHYEAAHSLQMRIRTALFYPAMVFVVMIFVAFALLRVSVAGQEAARSLMGAVPVEKLSLVWVVGTLTLMLAPPAAVLILLSFRKFRRIAVWRIPGFREASMSDLSGTMELLLKAGCSLPDSLRLVGDMEEGSPASRDIAVWRERLANGVKGPVQLLAPTVRRSPFPGLFRWLVSCGGEDLATGFRMASDFFRERAKHRLEIIVYAITPAGIIALTACSIGIVVPLVVSLARIMESLGAE